MRKEEKQLTEQNEIHNNFTFYQNLSSKQTDFKQNYLKEIYDTLKSMEIKKTPGNDELSKEFYQYFWDDVKIPLLASINDAFTKELRKSQKQTAITLIEKKDRDKRIIKNWTPITLLNINLKLIPKALAMHSKDTSDRLKDISCSI